MIDTPNTEGPSSEERLTEEEIIAKALQIRKLISAHKAPMQEIILQRALQSNPVPPEELNIPEREEMLNVLKQDQRFVDLTSETSSSTLERLKQQGMQSRKLRNYLPNRTAQ